MNTYTHTQPGTLIRIMFLGLIALLPCGLIFSAHSTGAMVTLIIVEIILLAALGLFHSLTVTVDGNAVQLKFGIGLIRTKFLITDITKVTPVRNMWYYGWGIRLLDNGYLYNVSGLDAVEVTHSSGAVHRIGTDEPNLLSQAIQNAGR